MKVLRRFGLSVVLFAGWLVIVLAVLLWTTEATGLLARGVRDVLAAGAGTLGDDVRVERARLRWFSATLELENVSIGELARVDAVRVELEPFSPGGPRVVRVETSGGNVVLSRALWTTARRYTESLSGPAAARGAEHVPTIVVEGLAVDAALGGPRDVAVGRLDALLRPDARGEPELFGRLVPSFALSTPEGSEICLSGTRRDASTFEVHASSARLPIETDLLPREPAFDAARVLEPHGLLDVNGFARFDLEGRSAPLGNLRLSLSDASLLVARGRHRITELFVDVQASWTPESAGRWTDPDALEALARVRGRVDRSAFDATAVWGRGAGEGRRAKCWVHAPSVPLDGTWLELAGDPEDVRDAWVALSPHGACEAWAAASLPRGDDLTAAPRIGVQLRLGGTAGLGYRGFPNERGAFDAGFPLPVSRAVGDVVIATDPGGERPFRAGLFDVAGEGGGARIRARGEVLSPPATPHPGVAPSAAVDMDLVLASERLPVGAPLFDALQGLRGALDPGSTWRPFAPRSGDLSVDLRLRHAPGMRYLAVDLDLGLTDVALAWSELPVAVSSANGRFKFRNDGVRESALSFALSGVLATASRIEVAGRFQTDPSLAAGPRTGLIDEISAVEARIEHASLTGDDARVFVERNVDVASALAETTARGFADVRYERTSEHGREASTTEVTARAPVELTPKRFEMTTRDVRGRVIVSAPRDGPTTTKLAPIVGTWGTNVDVAFTGRFPERTLRLYGAGIDPSSGALVGSLGAAMRSGSTGARGSATARAGTPGGSTAVSSGGASPGGGAALDTSAVHGEGALDFNGEIRVGDETTPGTSRYRIFLRDDTLATAEGFRLEALRGVLEFENGTMSGRSLRARVADTPIDLQAARLSTSDTGWRLEADFAARAIPIDDAHLAGLVDAGTRAALLGELEWKGSIDVPRGTLAISSEEGRSKLELSGAVAPRDMSIKLGLPIVIGKARANVDRFVIEEGRARALLRVEDFDGEVAGRKLRGASLLVTYVEPKLSIETLNGALEDGRIGALGESAQRGGTAFSISLEEPYAFQVALDLAGVEVAGLCRGLFPSNIATKGKLDARLRLSGDMGHLLGITGTGSVRIVDSKLWSVPVFRALLGQLGLDDTAIFDRMATNLRIRDGRLEMNDIAVDSALMQLVGDGHLDFDGGLHYDLDVRNALIDRLGPLRQLLYWLQNKLLSVAIRGDLARPAVLFVGPLDRLFGYGGEHRAIPLPPFSPLPPRF